jgi:hypothetical protein
LLLLTVIILPLTAGAAGFQFSGKFNEAWDKHAFELDASRGAVKLWINLPARSGLHVTATRDTAQVLDIHLTATAPVNLSGSGRYKFTVERDSGAGEWSCRDIGNSSDLRSVTSYADTTFSPRISFTTDEDEAVWQFSYPRSSAFMVDRIGPSGKAVEEFDLYDNNQVEYIGPGTATLQVRVTEGGGEFTAKLVQ